MSTLNTPAARRNTKSKNLYRREKESRKDRAVLGVNRKVTVDLELLEGLVEDLGLANLLALQEIVANGILAKMAAGN